MIKSTSYCTANEDGEEEITIVRSATLVESLRAMLKTRSFRRPATVAEVYVAGRTKWMDKATGVAPDADKQFDLFELKGYHKRQAALIEMGINKF